MKWASGQFTEGWPPDCCGLEPKVLRILNASKKVGIEHRVNEQHEATLSLIANFKVWIFYLL